MNYATAIYPDYAEVSDTLLAGETKTISVPLSGQVDGIGSVQVSGTAVEVQAIEVYYQGQLKGRFYPSLSEGISDYTAGANISYVDEVRIVVANTDTVNSTTVGCVVKYVRRELV